MQLCDKCSKNAHLMALGKCKNCGGTTSSCSYALCTNCALRLKKCQACEVSMFSPPNRRPPVTKQ
jgi:hypothetical protein